MLAWIAARCLDTSRQRPSAIVAMIFSNLIAQSGSGCLAHRNQPRVRQAARTLALACSGTPGAQECHCGSVALGTLGTLGTLAKYIRVPRPCYPLTPSRVPRVPTVPLIRSVALPWLCVLSPELDWPQITRIWHRLCCEPNGS